MITRAIAKLVNFVKQCLGLVQILATDEEYVNSKNAKLVNDGIVKMHREIVYRKVQTYLYPPG